MHEQQRKTVRQLREERDWTQFDLAVHSGVSMSSVVNIEGGRQEPRVSLAEKIARAFEVSVADIAWPSPNVPPNRRRPKTKPVA